MTSQLQVLNKILNTKDFTIITLHNLTEDYFFNYKAEFNYIKNHFKQFQAVPDKLTFANVFPDFDFIEVNEPDGYLVEQLIQDYNQSYLATVFNKIKPMLEKGEVDKAKEFYLNSINNLHKGSGFKCTDLMSDFSRYDRYLDRAANQQNYYIRTGFPELDKIIGGLDCENENLVIVARTGQGKTQTMLKMAAEAAKQGKVVGIYEGEMTADKVGARIDTFLGHINNTAINRGDLFIQQQYKQYLENLKLKNYGPIKVLTPADINGPATVEAIQAFVEQEGINALFIDQYSLLEDTSHASASHERIANISKAIKNLQVMKKIPVVSVAQMNRTKNDNGEQDTTQIGLSDRIGQDATVVLMLEKKDTKFTIKVAKSRDGGDNKKLSYNVNFNTGTYEYIPENGTEEEAQELEDSYAVKPVGEAHEW